MNLFSKFIKLPVLKQVLFIEAVFWLGLARLAVLMVPFRFIAPLLGRHKADTPEQSMPGPLKQISQAVNIMSRHLPWECKCLAQAIAAKMILKRKGFSSTLYLGMARDEKKFKAHAWVRSGNIIVTGHCGLEDYKIISKFS